MVVAVVVRFLVRELRARTLFLGVRLWIRPLLLVAIALALVGRARHGWRPAEPPRRLPRGQRRRRDPLAVRSTTLALGTRPGTVIARASWVTAAIWVVALLLRLVARIALQETRPIDQSALNAGTVGMVAAAFVVFATLIARRASIATA